jgi:hypothetical protein
MKLIFKQKINLKSTLKIKSKCFYCLNMFILSQIVVETWNWTFLKSFFLSNHSHKSYNNGEDTLNFQDSYFYFKSCPGSIFNHEQTKSDDYENLGVEICFIFLLASPCLPPPPYEHACGGASCSSAKIPNLTTSAGHLLHFFKKIQQLARHEENSKILRSSWLSPIVRKSIFFWKITTCTVFFVNEFSNELSWFVFFFFWIS